MGIMDVIAGELPIEAGDKVEVRRVEVDGRAAWVARKAEEGGRWDGIALETCGDSGRFGVILIPDEYKQ